MSKETIMANLAKRKWIAELLVYIFAGECVFGGSGRWFCIGNISVRIILFALSFFATLPFVVQERKQIFRILYIRVVVVFAVAVAISACIGFIKGNNLGFIWGDISGFLTLALLPGIFAVIDDESKLQRLLDVVFYTASFVALATVVCHITLAWLDDVSINALNDWINERNLGGLAMLETHLNRVYFRAQIFLQFAVLYGAWKTITASNMQKRVGFLACEGIMLFAIIASYTRGFWVGLVASAVILLALEWREWKSLLCIASAAAGVFAIISLLSVACYGQPYVFVEILNRFDSNLIVLTVEDNNSVSVKETVETPQVETSVPDDEPVGEIDIVVAANENAVNLRKASLSALNKNIAEHPLLGSGLGKNLDDIRGDGKTEYMYLDIAMKMGVIGCSVFLLSYLLSAVAHLYRRLSAWKNVIPVNCLLVRNSFLVAGYLGVAVTSMFNPFLTAPMGILMLCIINIAVFHEKSEVQL